MAGTPIGCMSLNYQARLQGRLGLDAWVQASKCVRVAAAALDKLLGEGINEAAFIFLTGGS